MYPEPLFCHDSRPWLCHSVREKAFRVSDIYMLRPERESGHVSA